MHGHRILKVLQDCSLFENLYFWILGEGVVLTISCSTALAASVTKLGKATVQWWWWWWD